MKYFDVTSGEDILEILDPPNTPIEPQLTPGTQYPEFGTNLTFFDIFVELDPIIFEGDGLDQPGGLITGEPFQFIDGTSSDVPGVTIPNFTGTAYVKGFDEVLTAPEPVTMVLVAASLGGLCLSRRGMLRIVLRGGARPPKFFKVDCYSRGACDTPKV